MKERLDALLRRLPAGADAAIILSPVNRQYLTGFSSSDGALLVSPSGSVFLTDFRYIEAARAVIRGIPCVCYHSFSETLCEELKKRDVRSLAYEQEYLTVAAKMSLSERLLGTARLESGIDAAILSMRQVKSEQELAAMERAQRLTDAAFRHILGFIREGVTERDIALELEFFMRKNGSQGVAFDTIVASGEHSSMPHAEVTDRVIRAGDLITMDYGAVVDGYRSDMTRTVAVGFVGEEERRVYDIVLAAQAAALETLRAGLPAAKGDEAAREIIRAAGYGDCFGHATGHSVGLEIHEEPRLSPRSEQILEENMVVTVEPGIYCEGRFGVRIEDMVIITKNGCKNLTNAQKSLIIIN